MNHLAAWAFALAHYEKPGVAEALLSRQDEEGLDVVLHLFALYAQEARGIVLDPTALQEADALMRDWREQVVKPLRAVRRAMKKKPAPGAGGESEAARQLVKNAELRAEQAELESLCNWLERRIRA